MVKHSWGFSLALAALVLVACAAPPRAASQALRAEVGAYQLEVLVDGSPVRTFQHGGETHVLGQMGSRYLLRVHNRTGRRIEAVISVDGLDVIDGKPADTSKRGYLIGAHDHVDIDGWRLSNREAAAFRFSPLGESYAAKTGSARNVGVIGVAVFPERVIRKARPVYVPAPSYYPTQDYYDGAEQESSRSVGGAGAMAEKSAAPAKRSAPAASAPSPQGRAEARDSDDRSAEAKSMTRSRGGLGTEFGEAVSSEIRQVSFVRAHASRPATYLGARYNDREGLLALGICVDGCDEPDDLALRQSANPFPVSRFARPPTDWRHN